MSKSKCLVAVILVSVSGLAACGPGTRGDDDDIVPGADAGPPRDGGSVEAVVYVHSADTLYTLDPQSFALHEVGLFALGEESITDAAVTPDGVLFGISKTKLYTIDTTTGAASYVVDVPGVDNVGLTFLDDGRLLATDKSGGVRRIDTQTGQVDEIGVFGGGYATAGDLVAVADGTMFAFSDTGPRGDEADNNWLLTVNTTTGVATPIKQIGFGQVFGAAFIDGRLLAFTRDGEVVRIDPSGTAVGELVHTAAGVEFWGAGVTPLVQLID